MAEQKQKKKILWQKYKEENIAAKEQQEYGHKFNTDADKIVIRKVSTIGKIFEGAGDVLRVILKVVVSAVVLALASFGSTVLINSALREAVFDIMKTW